jgi:ribonuclease HI
VFDIVIYCDGASKRNPGLGGWGALIVDEKKNVDELGEFCPGVTNNQMELTAVIKSLEFIESYKGKSIIILTDSSYVIHGIKDWVFGWKKSNWQTSTGTAVKNKKLWQSLDLVVEKIGRAQITWRHVPGHAGVIGNERVDQIASAFAEQASPQLYKGSFSSYKVFANSDLVAAPNLRSSTNKKKSNSKKKAYSYVSMVAGKVAIHATWKECSERVLGAKGAKFKKSFSKEDEASIIASWEKA